MTPRKTKTSATMPRLDLIFKGKTAAAGDSGTVAVGDYGSATAGRFGTALAGDYGVARVGDYGSATAGYSGTATAGEGGIATVAAAGTATAGRQGHLRFLWWDGTRRRYRTQIAYVGESGIQPDTPYCLDENHAITRDKRRASTDDRAVG